jgi:TIR domain
MRVETGAVPSATSQKVFICYRRDETSAHAGRLYDAMVARFGEGNVFMDVELAPGVDFEERITEVVSGCVALLVVMGRSWATATNEQGQRRLDEPDDFVRLELQTALRDPRITPIPVLVQGAEMPRKEILPPELQPLARRNAIELSDGRWRYDVARLIDSLDELLPDAGAPRRAAPDQPSLPAAGWRPAFEGAAVAGLAGLLGRRLAETLGELKPAETDESDAETIQHIWTELTRRTGTLALVGAALGLWLALRVFEVPPARSIVKGLLIGGLAGLLGGLIWALPVYIPDAKADFTERASIELVSLAVSGGLLGMLIGSIWRPRRRGAGFGVGAIAGLAFAAFVLAVSWKTKTPGERVWFSGLATALIAGSTLATMLARDRVEARRGPGGESG